MTGWIQSTERCLIDSTDSVVGIIGRDGREWLLPAALSGSSQVSVLRSGAIRVVYDPTYMPVGFRVNERDFVFAAPFTLNTNRGYRVERRQLMLDVNGTPIGFASSLSASSLFPVVPVDNGASSGGGGGTVYPAAISSPLAAGMGNSITQYGNAYKLVNAAGTITCTAPGVVTVPITAHGYGANTVYHGFLGNTTDNTYTGEGSWTVIDSANVSFTFASGGPSSGSTTAATNCFLGSWQSTSTKGTLPGLNSLYNGGLQIIGNYGQGGLLSTQMLDAMAKCIAKGPNLIILEAGVNDVKALAGAPATWAGVKALIDLGIAANIAMCVLTIEPVGNGFNSAQVSADTQSVNTSLKAYQVLHPDKFVVADTYSAMFAAGGNQDVKANYTSDGVHPTDLGASIKWPIVYAAISPFVTAPASPFPANSSDVAAWKSHALIKNYGPWSGTTTTASNTGMSGVQATKFAPIREAGSGTGVCSVIDRGNAALGWWQQIVYTPGGATDQCSCYIDFSASLATAGFAVGDKFIWGCEVNVTGMNAANCLGLLAQAAWTVSGSVDAGLQVIATPDILPAYRTDTFSQLLVAAEGVQIATGANNLGMKVSLTFSAASASPVTLQVGRVWTRKI